MTDRELMAQLRTRIECVTFGQGIIGEDARAALDELLDLAVRLMDERDQLRMGTVPIEDFSALEHTAEEAEARVKELEARGVIDDRDYQVVHQRAQQAEAAARALLEAVDAPFTVVPPALALRLEEAAEALRALLEEKA